jgi:hypothetical protein
MSTIPHKQTMKPQITTTNWVVNSPGSMVVDNGVNWFDRSRCCAGFDEPAR